MTAPTVAGREEEPRHPRRPPKRDYPLNFSVVTPAHVDQLSVVQTREIVAELRRGGVAWVRSDCAWALCIDPRCEAGVLALDVLLDHGGRPIPVTVADSPLAATVLRFSRPVIRLSEFWPNGLGIQTKPASRLARRLSRLLHAPDGVVVRVSQSIIERQISAEARLPITSAALRDESGQLVWDQEMALQMAIQLHEERTTHTRTFFVRDTRRRAPRLATHSSMFSVVSDSEVRVLRNGSFDVDDAQKAFRSNAGVDWSDAT